MRISDIFAYVRANTANSDPATTLQLINIKLRELWYTTDLPNNLREMNLPAGQNNIITLPWYVDAIVGVRRLGDSSPYTLYDMRPAYQDGHGFKDLLSWVEMAATPQLQAITNQGRLTLKLKRAPDAEFSVSVSYPGEFSVRETETLTFDTNTTSVSTTNTVPEISALAKTSDNTPDVYVYDISDNLIAVLPGNQADVYNKRIRVLNDCQQSTDSDGCAVYYVLFRHIPPYFTDISGGESIEDRLGNIVQPLVVAEILSRSGDTASMNRMRYQGQKAAQIAESQHKLANMGKTRPVSLTRNPHVTVYGGYL